MKISMNFFRKAVSISLVLAIFATFLALSTGCPPSDKSPTPPENGTSENGIIQPETFSWDTQRRVPRWRLGSQINWIKNSTWDEAIERSETSGKPIFCYISSYDSDLTSTIEDGILAPDIWGQTISELFVPWELDWWEAPSLAQLFLGNISTPAILILIPGTDIQTGEQGLITLDYWAGNDILSWPLHDQLIPLDNPDSIARIDEFIATVTGDMSLEIFGVNEIAFDEELDVEVHVADLFEEIHNKLLAGEDLWPEECLWLTYKLGHDDDTLEKLGELIETWQGRIDSLGTGLVWMPDSVFVPAAGHAIDPERNLIAFLVASVIGDYPVNPYKLTDSLKFMVTAQSGVYAGGFPAFMDIRSTHEGGSDYIDDGMQLEGLSYIEGRLLNPTMGPRDIMWVNARQMASLLEIVTSSPEIMTMDTQSGTKVLDFIEPVSSSILDAILENLGEPGSLTMEEQIYLIDFMNRVYQLTASSDVIYAAEEIATALVEREIAEGEVGRLVPLYPDMVIALHNFGWLMELEDVKECAREIAETGVKYSSGYDYLDRVRMAYAWDVVHSTCVHTTVISAPDDEVGLEMLMIGLERWDPGKVSQIVTPGVDDDLIERKWYTDMGKAAAFVCVDDMCKMPSFDGETLQKTLDEVFSDMHKSAEE